MSLIILHLKHSRRNAERLLSWERSTYESATDCFFDDQAKSPRNKVDCNSETAGSPPDPDFLRLFHGMLPQELRDLVYSYVIGRESATWTIQPHGLYFRFDRRIADIPARIIPGSLEIPQYPIFSTIRRELATSFFATNVVLLLYRYDSTTFDILTKLCEHTGCRPAQYAKRLQIFFCPPETAEDDLYCDEDAEFEWHHIFPRPKNVRSLALRKRLEADLHEIGVNTNKDYDREFVFVISEQEWQESCGPNGMNEWLCSIKDIAKIRLLWRDWEKVIT